VKMLAIKLFTKYKSLDFIYASLDIINVAGNCKLIIQGGILVWYLTI